jgi:O-acetyl-ADP-ribose deacetylase (regulator of RNase III)
MPLIGRLALPDGRVFEADVTDLLIEPTLCIVNAANGQLAHGGGVAAAIARAAGPDLEREGDEYVRAHGPIPTGEAVVTTAGRLPFMGVIHAVGPRQGEGDEEGKLTRALLAAFTRAEEHGWDSLSFPAISSGIFAVPVDVCARAYLTAVRRFFAEHPQSALRTIRLAVFDGPIVEAIRTEMAADKP